MKSKEDIFTHELEVFRTEVHSGIQFLYAYWTMNTILAENKTALNIVNRTSLFWNTNLGALNTSVFIVLGRIFDQNSNHNIDKLLNIAQNNSIIFSNEALEARKRKGSANAEEWIDDYMKTVYVPTSKDLRNLRKNVKKYRSIYMNKYLDIRRKIHAHKELSKDDDIKKLYSQTNIREMEKLFIFLYRIYNALWELYYNGNKPTLKPMKYSIRSMRKANAPKWQIKSVQERIVKDTQDFFEILLSCRPTTGWS
jgi:AbiU2